MFEFFVGLTIAITIAIMVASTILLVVGMFGIMLNKKFLSWYLKKIIKVTESFENGELYL